MSSDLPLASLDVLVIDCQTTGATPAHGAVLELGWAVARAAPQVVAQLESHWIALPAGETVPMQVRRLTGYNPQRDTSTLAPGEAWRRLRALLPAASPVPTAIHYAHFELAFLRDWGQQFEPEQPFPFDAVCVHAIACRLFPELPRRSLRALAGYLGHGVELERRCLGHVQATAFIWSKLAAELEQRGVSSWTQLREWLSAPAPARPRKRRYPLPAASYRALPDEPGVYRFLRRNGDVLYVGKAASLRRRVASHFTAGSATTERALEMLTQVHEIRPTPTASALEAALLENEEIKRLAPPYNIQLLDGERHTWFFDRTLDQAVPAPDTGHRRGPVPSLGSVRALRALQLLLEGTPPSVTLRARAVGAPERWAPDEAVFAEGFAALVERHGLVEVAAGRIEAELLRVARRLLMLAPEDAAASLESGDEAPASEPPVSEPPSLRSWDRERVLRHLERGLSHGHQLLQRARWLCLLFDCTILFREANRPPRLLQVQAGQVLEARTAGADLQATDTRPPWRPLPERLAALRERKQYDRSRTLTSELKRVLRDGGSVSVRIGRQRWLDEAALRAGLRWI
jgi:DNA polymerase III subunit epsilon